jgi:membrane-associated phospholipid phosphatase
MTTNRAGLLSTALSSAIFQIALLTAVMIGLGFLVTHVLVHVWPFTVEDQAVRTLVAARTPTLDRASNLVSLTAYTAGLTIALVVAGCTMRLAYHRWRESLFLVAAMLSQLVVYMLTARVVARGRPAVPQLDVFPPMRSFPSGHVSAAVAVYGGIAMVLAMRSRRTAQMVAWWVLFLVIPVAVAISRVYRGMHYPSDVAASFIDGFGCLWILRRYMLTPAEQRGSCES